MKKLVFLALSVFCINAQADNIEDLTASCTACHGEKGVAPSDEWPNLAGQQAGYLAEQIKAFKSGARSNPLMTAALVSEFSELQINAIAEFYAQQSAKQVAASDTINRAGQQVRARCVSCHGMTGITVTSVWPNLATQNAPYIKNQLVAFKSGARVSPIMQVIANELNEQQMADVAEYYSQLPAPN